MSYGKVGRGLAAGGARYIARPMVAPERPGTMITRAAPGVMPARAGLIPQEPARLWNALPVGNVEGHEPDPFYDVRRNYVDGLRGIEVDPKAAAQGFPDGDQGFAVTPKYPLGGLEEIRSMLDEGFALFSSIGRADFVTEGRSLEAKYDTFKRQYQFGGGNGASVSALWVEVKNWYEKARIAARMQGSVQYAGSTVTSGYQPSVVEPDPYASSEPTDWSTWLPIGAGVALLWFFMRGR